MLKTDRIISTLARSLLRLLRTEIWQIDNFWWFFRLSIIFLDGGWTTKSPADGIKSIWGRLQRTSAAKSWIFKPPPSPCPGVSGFPKPPPPRTSASRFFSFYTFLFLLIKTKFIAQFLFLKSLKCWIQLHLANKNAIKELLYQQHLIKCSRFITKINLNNIYFLPRTIDPGQLTPDNWPLALFQTSVFGQTYLLTPRLLQTSYVNALIFNIGISIYYNF